MTQPASNLPATRPASQTSLAKKTTVKELLSRPEYQSRFKEVLGKRANQFAASVISVAGSLPDDTDPASIVAAAMTAAVLDLPVNKDLGFAWIVPFKKGQGPRQGQFQLGAKGFIQLALRTGRYTKMNARSVNVEAVGGFDEVGEPKIDWSKIDETKPIVGYAFAFQMSNGFTKVCYWTTEKVKAHAGRYSQSFKSGYDSPWKSHFDQMALKTVIKNELRAWGMLSIELQRAAEVDSGVIDIDGNVQYPDATPQVASPDFGQLKKAGTDALLGDTNPLDTLMHNIQVAGFDEGEVLNHCRLAGIIDEAMGSFQEVQEAKPSAIVKINADWDKIAKAIDDLK